MSIDLNLLRTLVALVETRSVTRAAEKLGLSQPGLSSALSRLREQLKDPLFLRTSAGMLPTPCAEKIYGLASAFLKEFDENVEAGQFDAPSFAGEFRLAMGDAGEPDILPPLMNELEISAPKASVRSLTPTADEMPRVLESGEAEIAIGYYPELDGTGFLRQSLFKRSFVCMVRRDHPLRSERLSWEDFAACGHVGVTAPARSLRLLDAFLKDQGIDRRVALLTSHFMSLPPIVAQTNLLAIVPFAMGVQINNVERLRLIQLPFDAPEFTVSQHWHRRFNEQPRHRWLRGLLHRLFYERSGGASSTPSVLRRQD